MSLERALVVLLVVAAVAWLLATFVSPTLAAIVVLIGGIYVLAVAIGASRP